MPQAREGGTLPWSLHPSSPLSGRGEAEGATLLCPLNSLAVLPSPHTLQEVQVGIINATMCNHLFSLPDFRRNIWGDMVCAGDPQGGKDACFVSVPPAPSRPSGPWHPTPTAAPPPRPEGGLDRGPSLAPPVKPGGRGSCPTLQRQKLRFGGFQGEGWGLKPVCPAPQPLLLSQPLSSPSCPAPSLAQPHCSPG